MEEQSDGDLQDERESKLEDRTIKMALRLKSLNDLDEPIVHPADIALRERQERLFRNADEGGETHWGYFKGRKNMISFEKLMSGKVLPNLKPLCIDVAAERENYRLKDRRRYGKYLKSLHRRWVLIEFFEYRIQSMRMIHS